MDFGKQLGVSVTEENGSSIKEDIKVQHGYLQNLKEIAQNSAWGVWGCKEK